MDSSTCPLASSSAAELGAALVSIEVKTQNSESSNIRGMGFALLILLVDLYL